MPTRTQLHRRMKIARKFTRSWRSMNSYRQACWPSATELATSGIWSVRTTTQDNQNPIQPRPLRRNWPNLSARRFSAIWDGMECQQTMTAISSISMDPDYASFNAYFARTYPTQVNSPILQSKHDLLVRRSPQYSMKYPAGRD